MLTISAKDAQQLQKAGIPPEEYLAKAMGRIQEAIIDTARKGKSSVDVIVYDITLRQVPVIMKDLAAQGFGVTSDGKYNDQVNKVFKISWGG